MKIQIPSYESGATLDANAPSTSTMQHHTYNPRALSSLSSVAVFLVDLDLDSSSGPGGGGFSTLYLGEGEE